MKSCRQRFVRLVEVCNILSSCLDCPHCSYRNIPQSRSSLKLPRSLSDNSSQLQSWQERNQFTQLYPKTDEHDIENYFLSCQQAKKIIFKVIKFKKRFMIHKIIHKTLMQNQPPTYLKKNLVNLKSSKSLPCHLYFTFLTTKTVSI